MKSLAANFALVALLASPLVGHAQPLPGHNGRARNLALLPGPYLLSQPRTAALPGFLSFASSRPPYRATAADSFVAPSATLNAPALNVGKVGQFVLRPSSGRAPAVKPASADSLRFDAQLPKIDTRPLREKLNLRRP